MTMRVVWDWTWASSSCSLHFWREVINSGNFCNDSRHYASSAPAQGLGALWHQIQNYKCLFSANSMSEHCVRHSKMSRGMRRGPSHKDRINWKSRCAQINCETQHRAKNKSFGNRQTWVQISVDHLWVVISENYLNLILENIKLGIIMITWLQAWN